MQMDGGLGMLRAVGFLGIGGRLLQRLNGIQRTFGMLQRRSQFAQARSQARMIRFGPRVFQMNHFLRGLFGIAKLPELKLHIRQSLQRQRVQRAPHFSSATAESQP